MNTSLSRRAGKLSLTLLLVLLAGLAVGGVAGYQVANWLRAQAASRGGPMAPLEITRISALGRLEPRDGIVTVSGIPGDRIEQVLVQEGKPVGKETPLVRLTSHQERKLARDLVQKQLDEAEGQKAELEKQRQAQLDEIDAEIEKIRSGQREDLAAQDAKIALITTQERVSRGQLDRLKSLKLTTVSPQEMDQQGLLVEQAERELAAAAALRRKTVDTYKQSEAVAQAKRRATEATFNRHVKEIPLESLKKNLELADQRRKDGEIFPVGDGQVLRILAKAGETSGQPILQLGDTRHMVVVAEVYETQVQALRDWPDVEVTISSPALRDQSNQPQKLQGRLAAGQIGRMISRNTAFSPDPREDRDRRVVEVHVDIPKPEDAKLAAQFVNLQVTVEFSRKEP